MANFGNKHNYLLTRSGISSRLVIYRFQLDSQFSKSTLFLGYQKQNLGLLS